MLKTKVPQFSGNQLGVQHIVLKVKYSDLTIFKLTHTTTDQILVKSPSGSDGVFTPQSSLFIGFR
jgi:hypothetical protein